MAFKGGKGYEKEERGKEFVYVRRFLGGHLQVLNNPVLHWSRKSNHPMNLGDLEGKARSMAGRGQDDVSHQRTDPISKIKKKIHAYFSCFIWVSTDWQKSRPTRTSIKIDVGNS